MNCEKWLSKYKDKLCGKTVVLFGATGGIGNELCRYILRLGGALCTVDRNPKKAKELHTKLKKEYPFATVTGLIADLEDMTSVKPLCDSLKAIDFDIIIHNAGAYSIPRHICDTGFNNVFQINFISPYYIIRQVLPKLSERKGAVVAVGSIAHNYSKTDQSDIDFSKRKASSLVYGNAKRYLMYSLLELSREYPDVGVSVVHPGITLTNITAHYPKWLFRIIKHPMRIIFMPPRVAALSIIEGMFRATKPYSWLGPRFFGIWGKPSLKKLSTADLKEIKEIYITANEIYDKEVLKK